ncbi:uncharacterized protein LOC119603215 [Lucilia sericata]|uniref:uncharacterized protein LOC119603215 n=1 Tax=Lucilia sericata TaxID=13632 RepID=UPI0018A83586|nr:uncharacterized protein LOC119603215 [Lucilia sericata]
MPRKSFVPPVDPWERKKLDEIHQKNLKNARSLVDFKPPKIFASTYLRVPKLKDDFVATRRILKDNIHLLTKLNCIQKTHGFTDNVNKIIPIKSNHFIRLSKRLKEIEEDNHKLGKRILKAKSSMDTRRGMEELRALRRNNIKSTISQATMREYMEAVNCHEPYLMGKLLRPKVFIDLYVKNVRPLGRIVIQLYTEACPELVLEFVRLCSYRNTDLLKFIRIFPLLWIEGELCVPENVLNCPGFLYNMHCLDHGMGPGVLSFAKCYLNGFPPGLLNFSISFKALSVLNGERVPFGVVSQGLKVLDCLQDYGTKNGKTKKDIVVVNCGMWR